MDYNEHKECSKYTQSNITTNVPYAPISNLSSDYIDKLQETDEDEDVALAFLPTGPSKLILAKVKTTDRYNTAMLLKCNIQYF